jgi:hypothetical protein
MVENLDIAINEKDIENVYRHNFLKIFKDMEITSPFGCDGFGVSKSDKVRVLMEFKDDLNLQNKVELSKILAQSIFYVKRFYDKGIIPPTTIFIGDRNECTALHVNDIVDYLSMDIDWSVAPSQAHTIAPLILRIIQDEKVNMFIFHPENFNECIDKIKDLTDNIQRKVLITDKNITEVFRYFETKVLGKHKLTTNQLANLFIHILINDEDNYLHPIKKRKTIVTKSFGEVPVISRDAYTSFFGHFSSSYSPTQKDKLVSMVDRLVEDTTRRKQGEFFTPAIWVDKAHEYITSVYGENWKNEYVVWDPAWGTGNLTRDYKFKELYVSTLNQSDIDTANQMGYNTEAVKFQYDFLNDEYEKLPEGLRKAIENGRQIIVLMNPPYGAGSELEKKKNKSKSKIADCLLTKEMIQEGYGQSIKQMYSYFFYRFIKMNSLDNINLAVFVPPTFLSGGWFIEFREKLFKKFSYQKGFLFNAKHFDSVSEWGLGFHLLKSEKSVNKETFILDVIEQNEDFELLVQNTKTIYNINEKQNLRNFIKPIKDKKITTFVPLTSVFNVQNNPRYNKHPFLPIDSLGSIIVGGNSVYTNGSALYISSTYTNQGASSPIAVTPENLYRVCMLFSSRTLIKSEWINQKDEYLVPNFNLDETLQFQIDSIIISLFNNSSNQSSLRQITYKDKLWDIKNEFFWMSKDRMKELADENGYDNLYNDARTSSDRYVYKLLFGEERIYDKLSPDAKSVLDKATELVEKSMELRQVMANDENHLDSWDAGYAQLKLVWKEYFPQEFKEFRMLYKNLEDRMRPLVYELGFLIK